MRRRYRAEATREQVQTDGSASEAAQRERFAPIPVVRVNRSFACWAQYPLPGQRTSGMVSAQRGKPEGFLENYCARLGTLLEARYTGLALLAAKQEADTAAKHANEAMLEAKAADLAKTRFLANMAHELRTQLNAIIGFSEIIKLDAIQTKERYPLYAEYIHDAGMLLLNIINGLLDLARIQAGNVELEEKIVTVGEVNQSAVRTISPNAE